MTTSKSFRAILPSISDEEVQRLQAWSAENCAAAAVFREADYVVWLASKERARSREAFLRSVRGVLKRLAIDVNKNLLNFVLNMERALRKWTEERHENGKCVSVERTERNITTYTALLPSSSSSRWSVGLGIEHLFEMSKSGVGLRRH